VLRRQEADRIFRTITAVIGLRTDTARPRIHDLRHTFAVRTQIGGVASDATFPGMRERSWPALRRWNPRSEVARAGSKVAGDLRWHYPVASAHTMMHPDLLHPAAA
jgi:hypothetical protein